MTRRSTTGRRAGLLGFAIALALGASSTGARGEVGVDQLAIDTASGSHVFEVEVMRTEAEKERGLMFRRYLPKARGMLFDFKTEQPILMWMKNTYIPLDMVFMNHEGRVVGIARNAEPLSETIIPSGAAASSVLEINAGEAAAIGVKVGDTVQTKALAR